jgi:putative flippase GtrA
MRYFRTVADRTDEPGAGSRLSTGSTGSAVQTSWPGVLLAGRMLRFAVVGAAGIAVNTAALYLLYRWLRVPLVVASAAAVELTVVHNYFLNDRWTFAVRAPSIRRFGKFNVSMLGGLAVNVLVLWTLMRGGVHLLPANLLAIGAAFAVNYASSTLWVWGRTRGRPR